MNKSALESYERALRIKKTALKLVHLANASHIGSCLSMADIIAVLYSGYISIDPKNPDDVSRDRFILSKGHATAMLYSVLADVGFFPYKELENYCQDGSCLAGHNSHHVPGVEFSTGSLGHGLSLAAGIAIGLKRSHSQSKAFVLLSDGELNEGSVWEAALFAGHHKLSNLTAIVDHNKLQGFGRVQDVLDLHPLADKFKSFGWEVRQIDGHDHDVLHETFQSLPFAPEKPSVIIAHTIKGNGISFMEGRMEWHYRSLNDELLEKALAEMETCK